jgi:hypothetical protein
MVVNCNESHFRVAVRIAFTSPRCPRLLKAHLRQVDCRCDFLSNSTETLSISSTAASLHSMIALFVACALVAIVIAVDEQFAPEVLRLDVQPLQITSG